MKKQDIDPKAAEYVLRLIFKGVKNAEQFRKKMKSMQVRAQPIPASVAGFLGAALLIRCIPGCVSSYRARCYKTSREVS